MLFKKGKASDMNYSSEPETIKLANVLLGSFALFFFNGNKFCLIPEKGCY